MIFLIEYDRPAGQLVSIRRYDDSQSEDAANARLERELELLKAGETREVVILQAATEVDLRRTHRRYFETLEQLATLPDGKS